VAGDDDETWMREVHHAAFREVVERQFGTWDEAQQDALFHSEWIETRFEVIECEGSRCGYVCIEDRDADVHVRIIVIAPEFQNRGIGTAIILEAIEHARSRGVPVVLGTHHQNRAADLYRRLGFVQAGATETHRLFRLDPV
jgi:ribosomal protein S18 acetylase RimI-like enzyme